MELREALTWLMSVGSGPATYWLMERVPALAELEAASKRSVSLAIAACLPVLAWLALVGLGYQVAPVGWVNWVERLFSLMAPAVIGSQYLHGKLQLAGKTGQDE